MNDASTTSIDEFLGEETKRRFPRWARWVGIALALLLMALLVRSFFFSGPDAPSYATSELRRGDMQVTVTATGNLAPTNEVAVGSELSGLIERVMVDVNDKVTRGQALAVIDTEKLMDATRRSRALQTSARANVLQAQATAAQSRALLARQEEVFRLSGGKVPSRTEMDAARAENQRARANLAVARANVESAAAQLSTDRTNLSKATIRSPVTGVILAREIEPGQTVVASFNTPTLFRIAEDLGQMELEVKVDEADVGQVSEGQDASFTVDAYPGQTFPAAIRRVNVGSNVSAAASASTSAVVSYGAVLSVENPEQILRPGMTATATIITSQEQNVLLVPNAALRYKPSAGGAQRGRGPSILPVPGRFRRRSTQEVSMGRGSRQTIHVLDAEGNAAPHQVIVGATNGSETIVSGEALDPGMKVITGALVADR